MIKSGFFWFIKCLDIVNLEIFAALSMYIFHFDHFDRVGIFTNEFIHTYLYILQVILLSLHKIKKATKLLDNLWTYT